jgi:hypothetical protein
MAHGEKVALEVHSALRVKQQAVLEVHSALRVKQQAERGKGRSTHRAQESRI